MNTRKAYKGCRVPMAYCAGCNTPKYSLSSWSYVFLIIGVLTVLFGWLTGILIFWGMPSTLYDADYAAKTLHMHKVKESAPIPQHWNSLGPMYSASLTHFMHDDRAFETKEAFTDADAELLASVRDHAFGHTMYVNGMTLSILSSISPTLYLGTLVLVCTLSCVRFVSEMFFDKIVKQDGSQQQENYCGINSIRSYVYYFLLISYGLFVFIRYVVSGTDKTVTWENTELTQHYIIPLQIPSLVYCVIILGIYYVHLTKMGDKYWQYVKENAESVVNSQWKVSQEPSVMVPPPLMVFPVNDGSGRSDLHFRPPVQFNSVATLLKPPLVQQVWMDTPNLNMSKMTEKSPVANETSVTVCFIVVLGTIASLGMSSAFMPETLAQLVILSVIMFTVLEIARMHLVSFFWYLNKKTDSDDTDYYQNMELILAFIELVVFLLQVLFFVIWQTSIDSVTIESTDNMITLRNLLFFVTIGFLLLRLLAVVYALVELGGTVISNKLQESKAREMFYWPETVVYVLCVLAVIWTLFAISVTPKDTKGERRLLFYEQQMYMQTSVVAAAPTCDAGLGGSKMLYQISKTPCEENEVYDLKNSRVFSPVHMKVFAWTRAYKLDDNYKLNDIVCNANSDNKCSLADVLFCANGLEQHWGQCHDYYNTFPINPFLQAWQSNIDNSTTR